MILLVRPNVGWVGPLTVLDSTDGQRDDWADSMSLSNIVVRIHPSRCMKSSGQNGIELLKVSLTRSVGDGYERVGIFL